jgi:hypothetical protein
MNITKMNRELLEKAYENAIKENGRLMADNYFLRSELAKEVSAHKGVRLLLNETIERLAFPEGVKNTACQMPAISRGAR